MGSLPVFANAIPIHRIAKNHHRPRNRNHNSYTNLLTVDLNRPLRLIHTKRRRHKRYVDGKNGYETNSAHHSDHQKNERCRPVADPAADKGEGRGGKKHEIYTAAFGDHLFYDLFLQDQGAMAPSASLDPLPLPSTLW